MTAAATHEYERDLQGGVLLNELQDDELVSLPSVLLSASIDTTFKDVYTIVPWHRSFYLNVLAISLGTGEELIKGLRIPI